jgi:hypothetical protein
MVQQPLDLIVAKKKELLSDIEKQRKDWRHLRNINRNWDGFLTVSTIVLTLFITVIGTDGIKFADNDRKLLTGVMGAIVVAINSIGNAFPVKQRAGGYRTLESQALTLKSKLIYLVDDSEEIKKELPNISSQFLELIIKSSEIENK